MQISDSDDYDDEDTVTDEDFAAGQLGQFMGADEDDGEYFTWDLLLKNIFKLPPPEAFLQRREIRHERLYQTNKWQYNLPFLVFYRDASQLPHAFELQQFYERFHAQAYPEKEICMAGHKCKSHRLMTFASLHRAIHHEPDSRSGRAPQWAHPCACERELPCEGVLGSAGVILRPCATLAGTLITDAAAKRGAIKLKLIK